VEAALLVELRSTLKKFFTENPKVSASSLVERGSTLGSCAHRMRLVGMLSCCATVSLAGVAGLRPHCERTALRSTERLDGLERG
jgi:hypothetical protein